LICSSVLMVEPLGAIKLIKLLPAERIG